MNQIIKQVSRAQRRMLIGRFFRIFCWAFFGGLLLAVIGLAIPKIWHLSMLATEANQTAWTWGWIGGGVLLSVIISVTMTLLGSASRISAAVEIDQRYGLKERISSALSLDAQTANSEAGRALIEDAIGRAETIDVRDQFGFKPTWRALMPVIPIALISIILFIPFALASASDADADLKRAEKEQVKVAIEQAKKRLQKRAAEMQTKGLKDGKAKLDELQKKIDDLAKTSQKDDKKQSLVKLNDIRKAVSDRQKDLSGAAELKKALKKLDQVAKGPAKQLEQAMKSGNFDQAQKAIKELADKLKSGKLSDVEKKKLAKDLKDLADQMKDAAKKQEQEKKELQERIKQAQREGDLNKAAELQKQLEKKEQQQNQMEKMKQMAKKMQAAAKAMQQQQQQQKGQPGQQQPKDAEKQAEAMRQAAQALEDMAEQMEQMQQDMDELEDLKDLADDLQDCKDCMQGNCEGEGQEGKKDGEPKWNDWAKGEGRGGGKREREEEDTGGYKSKVEARLQRGKTTIAGSADGANITGSSISEAREAIKSAMGEKSDPLENQKLPKSQREHAKEYFKGLRGN